nr:MAG TPA: hypothetical protein [Caudoviricetes sp.]
MDRSFFNLSIRSVLSFIMQSPNCIFFYIQKKEESNWKT